MAHITRSLIDQYDKQYRTNLINSVNGFKSAALIGTINQQGITNLAIFSQILHIGANPPLVGILFRPHTVVRHTLENILSIHSFTINHIPENQVIKAHHTSARWENSEFDACGFTPEYMQGIAAPFVQEANVKIACAYRTQQEIMINGTLLVIGEIMSIQVPDDCLLEDGFVDLEKAGSVTSCGLDSYHMTTKIGRYSYAKPGKTPEQI